MTIERPVLPPAANAPDYSIYAHPVTGRTKRLPVTLLASLMTNLEWRGGIR